MLNVQAPTPIELKRALRTWVEKKEISIPDFARQMNYTYMHAHALLRGKRAVSAETLGRVVLHYGPEAAAEITELANSNGQKE